MSKTGGHTSNLVRAGLPAFALDDRCIFVKPCLEYALPLYDLWGVWGATTVDEREAMRRRAEGKARGQR